MTDSQGNVISRRDFLPFGEHLDPDVGGRSSVTAYQPTNDNVKQKFTTYQRDEESGLDFAEARMYENRHARFTAVDPLLASGKSANPQTFNRYTYVLNSPLVNTDPTGLQTDQNPEYESGTVDGGTSRACQYFGFACRAWTWVKEKTCYGGDCVTTRTQIPSSTSPSQDGRNFLNNFTNTEAENLGERKQGNIFVPSPSAPRRSFAPFGTPESVENAERLFDNDPSGVLPWANSMRKLEEGRGSRFDVAINSVNVLTNIIPGGKPTKSVGLGVERIGGRLVLEELTEKTGATIYKNWAKEGLTSRTVENRFGRAFNQAVSRADEIHFALDGLIDDLPGALDRGRRFGFSVPRRNVTNAELFTIANNPDLLRKTTFYVNNRPIPSPFW